ncbi:MAG: hypothetical protein V4555_08530 [Acidobacteriota bacterium]
MSFHWKEFGESVAAGFVLAAISYVGVRWSLTLNRYDPDLGKRWANCIAPSVAIGIPLINLLRQLGVF